jgi:hypothetical protein
LLLFQANSDYFSPALLIFLSALFSACSFFACTFAVWLLTQMDSVECDFLLMRAGSKEKQFFRGKC